MTYAFIFPGQGSQYPGMGKDLAEAFQEARFLFEEIDDALQQNLSKLMFDGPEEDLNLTENTQPALLAVSLAVIRVLEKQGNVSLDKASSYVAGHSLGEYSALTAVGAFELVEAAKLVKLRGQAMQKAVPVGQGGMAAILGLNFDEVKDVVLSVSSGSEVSEIANDNCPGQIVVSGHRAAIDRAIEIAKEKGAKRAVSLPVSAPFHSSLMAPAAQTMAGALANTDIRRPCVPVISNVTAQAESDPDRLRTLLVEQITGMVRWTESVLFMKEAGVTDMVEIGAGKVLSGLVRRIDKTISCLSVETPEQIETLINTLKG